MMAYMGTVIVILLNILVAQMSTTYSQAKKVARLEYDVDRILQLTRMERFPFLVSKHKYLHSSENWEIILPIAELFLHLFFWAEFAREVLPRRRLDQWNETRTRSGKKDLTARTCFTICCNLRKTNFPNFVSYFHFVLGSWRKSPTELIRKRKRKTQFSVVCFNAIILFMFWNVILVCL